MRRLAAWALLGALAGTGGFRLFQCRYCDGLVNCTDKWGQEVKCATGHMFKCPPQPAGPGVGESKSK